MSIDEPIKVAHCGLGKWGPNLLRNLGQNPKCEVVALCDLDKARLAEFGKQHPNALSIQSVEEIAANDSIQAAVLATPAGLHATQVRLLLEAGKDVLVEKPLAMGLDEAAELVSLAKERGSVLMVGHTFLFNPAVRRVKEEISKGALGDLQLVLAQRLSLGRIREDCNALWNLAPHDVSILLYWLGQMPLSVSARGIAFRERHRQEDFALCVLEFPNRVTASIQVSWLNPVKIRQMTIVGSERMLLYDDVNREQPLTLYHQRVEEVPKPGTEGSFEGYQLQVQPGREEALDVEDTEPLRAEVDHFLDCIRTRETPIGSGHEALRIMSVLDACDRSLKNGGTITEARQDW